MAIFNPKDFIVKPMLPQQLMLSFLLFGLVLGALGEQQIPNHPVDAADTSRPLRTALVLGGGGARGAAHIGVLEVLEREHVPVDCVVGTSMGALVAGAYAAGLSPAEMRSRLGDADWTDIFLDEADYSQLSYRKKAVTRGLLVGSEIGITKNGAQISPGVIAGEKIKLFFNHLVGDHQGERLIEELPLPLAIVATDIGTGDRVVLKQGSLTLAMRASMSVPGLMAPVEYEGHKLVDGGLVDNLPIALGRELCQADRVIAVNVGSPLRPAEEIGSLLSVTGQMIGILTNQNVERSLSSLSGNDVYIYPALDDIKATDFKLYAEAADIGREAAEKQLAMLQAFSVSSELYADWKQQHHEGREPITSVDEITIAPLKRVNPEFVARLIRQKEGAPINRPKLEQDLIRVYGSGYFDRVDYRISQNQGRKRLEIIPTEKNWSADYATFGYAIEEEYREGASVNLRGAYRSTWVNSYGGELFAVIDVGSDPYFEIDFNQPLDARHRYFVEPSYVKGREQINLFLDGEKLAEYKLSTNFVQLVLGRNLGILGQTRAGWREYHMEGEADANILRLPEVDERYYGWLFETSFDQQDRLYFPSKGWAGNLNYFKSAEQSYEKLSADLSAAFPVSDFVLIAHSSYITALDGDLPIFDSAMLGGLYNMSGYATNQILAGEAAFINLRLEKIIGRMPMGLSGDLRLGLSLEGAQIENGITMTDANGEWIDSAAIYLGGETPIGPVYIGYGFTSSGDFNLYFQIGQSVIK